MTSCAPCTTKMQRAGAALPHPKVPKHCVVTGGSGFVGQRLVEMLVERGAETVVSFDISPPPPGAWADSRIKYMRADIRNKEDVLKACKGADCVWHIAAAVGPFHPTKLYEDVNYQGTLHVIEACKKHGVKKIVMASSPSTRMDGSDIDGLREDEMLPLPQKSYLQEYARTKAMGEMAVRDACCDDLLTVAIAPHQVYGPRDNLFLPNILETGATGKLRVFGPGTNRICFSHVDNYCHALILGERALYPGSQALGKFYIATDGDSHPCPKGYAIFWDEMERAVTSLGMPSIKEKVHLPVLPMMIIAYLCSMVGYILGIKMKLTPFTVRMLTINRWFDISNAQRDLGYYPIVPFKEGWEETIEWFRTEWLPRQDFAATSGYGKIARQTEDKIRTQM
eukprot:Sspe_Gene.30222::Locus_14864_Transcript_1_1_Confidence_1.000_Length_1320::g.30222::m.30222